MVRNTSLLMNTPCLAKLLLAGWTSVVSKQLVVRTVARYETHHGKLHTSQVMLLHFWNIIVGIKKHLSVSIHRVSW